MLTHEAFTYDVSVFGGLFFAFTPATISTDNASAHINRIAPINNCLSQLRNMAISVCWTIVCCQIFKNTITTLDECFRFWRVILFPLFITFYSLEKCLHYFALSIQKLWYFFDDFCFNEIFNPKQGHAKICRRKICIHQRFNQLNWGKNALRLKISTICKRKKNEELIIEHQFTNKFEFLKSRFTKLFV